MSDIDKTQGIADLPAICASKGIEHAVVSPGSRNAPIILSFLNHNKIKCLSVVDERVAGFVALGISLNTGKPVIVNCTSGSALLNYSPAIAEAYYRGIPLIIISADRPPELIDQGDGQTINQLNVYANFIKASYQLPVKTDNSTELWNFHRLISDAINQAISVGPGPVHINVPLREPLYKKLPIHSNYIQLIKSEKSEKGNFVLSKELANIWHKSKSKVIIVGFNTIDKVFESKLNNLAKDESTLIFAENLSNVQGAKIISAVDRFYAWLEHQDKLGFNPDLLIVIGNQVLSKKAKLHFRNNKPKFNWSVVNNYRIQDTFMSQTHVIESEEAPFIDALIEATKESKIEKYQSKFIDIDKQLEAVQNKYINALKHFTDLKAYSLIFSNLPEKGAIHLGNSTPVRYAHLFNTNKNFNYFANRGVSGIDGCLSTAIGYARYSTSINLVILGDLSFLYDSNALWVNDLPNNLRIIVLNNSGGDIFRIINPDKKNAALKSFLETPVSVDFEKLISAFNLEYLQANSSKELSNVLQHFYNTSDKAKILEIKTDIKNNAGDFTGLYKNFNTTLP